MKNLLLILLLVLAGEISAQQAATNCSQDYPGQRNCLLAYRQRTPVLHCSGNQSTSRPSGRICPQFRTDRPGMVQVWTQGSDSFTLYLTPGSKDTITVTKDTLIISGTNSAYNRCLKTVNDYQKYSDKLVYMQPHELRGITSLEQYHRAGRRQNAAGTRRCKCFRTQ